MITTQVTWNPNSLSTEQLETIRVKVNQLAAAGATDGTTQKNEILPDGNRKVIRRWATVDDAKTWIKYISDFDPVSAELVEQIQ